LIAFELLVAVGLRSFRWFSWLTDERFDVRSFWMFDLFLFDEVKRAYLEQIAEKPLLKGSLHLRNQLSFSLAPKIFFLVSVRLGIGSKKKSLVAASIIPRNL
jgi:hypothetical protein